MIKCFKILLIVIVLVLSLFVFSYRLQADVATDPYPFVYLFHLYYDNGQLFADRDFEFKYDLIAEPFVQQSLSTATPHKGEVVNLLGKVVGAFQFDPTVVKGKISVKGPYFSDAEKVNFYNSSGELLLVMLVSESSVCDDDGVCDKDVGENYQNCPNDCQKPSPSPAIPPPVPFWQNPFFIGLAALIFAIAVLVIWGIIRRKRASVDQNQNLPPIQSL